MRILDAWIATQAVEGHAVKKLSTLETRRPFVREVLDFG